MNLYETSSLKRVFFIIVERENRFSSSFPFCRSSSDVYAVVGCRFGFGLPLEIFENFSIGDEQQKAKERILLCRPLSS